VFLFFLLLWCIICSGCQIVCFLIAIYILLGGIEFFEEFDTVVFGFGALSECVFCRFICCIAHRTIKVCESTVFFLIIVEVVVVFCVLFYFF